MEFKKIMLTLLVSVICSCTAQNKIVEDFYYTYSYNLFDDYVPNTNSDTFGIAQYIEASYVYHSDEKVQMLTVYEGESILPFLNSMPNIEPRSGREVPLRIIVGIFKDESLTQMVNNNELKNAKKGFGSIYLSVKTYEEFIDENLAPVFLSGKWVNKKGLEMVINYPSLELKFDKHSFKAKLNRNGVINKESIQIDNKSFKGEYRDITADFDLLAGTAAKAYLCPRDYACSYYNCYFLEHFFDYIGFDIEEEYFDYIQFRSLYKGVEYTF